MLLATIALLTPAIARFRFFLPGGPLLAIGGTTLFVLACMGATNTGNFGLFSLSLYTPSALCGAIGLGLFLSGALQLLSDGFSLPSKALIALGLRHATGRFVMLSVVGAIVAVVSFPLTGHVSTHPDRWLLTPLLLIHLLVVAFWFGALWPLAVVSALEPPQTAGRVIEAFSATAIWLVPLILLAGSAIAVLLLSSLAALMQPYGELLLTKLVLFALLMVFAALNRWRFGPAIAVAEPQASAPP